MDQLKALQAQVRDLSGRVDDLSARLRQLEHVAEVASEIAIYHLAPAENLREKHPDGYRTALSELWKVMPRPDDPSDNPLWRFHDSFGL